MQVIANKVLAFDQGELDAKGILVRYATKIGHCELPDWVAEHPYFKMAVADGSINAFTSISDSDAVQREQQRLDALREEIKALEERKEALSTANASLDTEIADRKDEVAAKANKKDSVSIIGDGTAAAAK